MRLIDADALSDALYHEAFETDTDMQRWDSGCWIRYKMFENARDNAPTITIERDIPKAPTDQQLEEDGYGAWGSLYGECPNCRASVYEEQNYCEKCGQRLDWGRDDKAD